MRDFEVRFGMDGPFGASPSGLETGVSVDEVNWYGWWQLTISETSHMVRTIPGWCIDESAGFHLGNSGSEISI